MNTVNKNKFISTSEAAKILKISRIAVFKKIKSGELRAVKIGRNYAIEKEELDKMGNPMFSGKSNPERIEKAVDRTVQQYKETLELLGKDDQEK